MFQFLAGVLIGMSIMGFTTFIVPLHLIGVQQKLVEQDHGYYHPTTARFTLKECK